MLPLFCVMTGISHRVQLAILVNFPNAVLNATRSILKKDKRRSDPWDFLLKGPIIINRREVGYFFHGRRGTEPDPPPHTHKKQVEKILTPSDKTF